MITVTVSLSTIDEQRLAEVFRRGGRLSNRMVFGSAHRAHEVIQFGLVGRLQISDGEHDLFETEGDGPGESDVNILGVLFDAHHALERWPAENEVLETAFGPDWYSLQFRTDGQGRMIAETSRENWVAGDRRDWRAGLDQAFHSIRTWIVERADFLLQDVELRRWVSDGVPPRRRHPFGEGETAPGS